jgi:hypothetical protein
LLLCPMQMVPLWVIVLIPKSKHQAVTVVLTCDIVWHRVFLCAGTTKTGLPTVERSLWAAWTHSTMWTGTWREQCSVEGVDFDWCHTFSFYG